MKRSIFIALGAGVAALVAGFPLSWVAPLVVPAEIKTAAPDLTYRGTLWNGSVSGLPMFGTANVDLSLFSRKATVQAGEGRAYFNGTLGSSSAQDVRLVLDLSDVPLTDGRLDGVVGTVDATVSEMRYDATGCLSASGTVRTDVLQRNGGNIDWTGPELTGPLRCEDGALIADVSGQDSEQTVTALLRIFPDGTYRADITAQTSRAEADAVLPLFGFSRQGRDFKLTEQGNWR